MEIAKVYPLDAVYDTPEDVPEDVMLIAYDVFLLLFPSRSMNLLPLQVKANKRYAGASNWTVKVSCNCNVPLCPSGSITAELWNFSCPVVDSYVFKSGRRLLRL